MRMSEQELRDYIETNDYDWIGDDYDHINEYLFTIMNSWQDAIEYDTEGYDNPDYMTVTWRAREWVVDPDEGYRSENKYEVAYQILMDYWDSLPDDEKPKIHERLETIGV